MLLNSFNKKLPLIRGFTLTELMVSMGIVASIISIIVLRQDDYTEGVALQNQAADIGLSIREAQTYGISVKQFTPGSGEEFPPGYGVEFDITGAGSKSAYILFADRNGDGIYSTDWACTPSSSSECIEKPGLILGNQIDENGLCYVQTSTETCIGVGAVVITFVRPETNAIFKFYSTGGLLMSPTGVIGAKIKLISPGGLKKSVLIHSSGQVSIQ
ncbi:MAG: prepilin-type N-terminal cleavage/methylation domain-containing protein [Parcubacteria group bacterium]